MKACRVRTCDLSFIPGSVNSSCVVRVLCDVLCLVSVQFHDFGIHAQTGKGDGKRIFKKKKR